MWGHVVLEHVHSWWAIPILYVKLMMSHNLYERSARFACSAVCWLSIYTLQCWVVCLLSQCSNADERLCRQVDVMVLQAYNQMQTFGEATAAENILRSAGTASERMIETLLSQLFRLRGAATA